MVIKSGSFDQSGVLAKWSYPKEAWWASLSGSDTVLYTSCRAVVVVHGVVVPGDMVVGRDGRSVVAPRGTGPGPPHTPFLTIFDCF